MPDLVDIVVGRSGTKLKHSSDVKELRPGKGGKEKKANLSYNIRAMDILSAQEERDNQQLWAQRGCSLEMTRIKREEVGDLSQTEKEGGNPIGRY